jgi:hypothetical protein
MLYKISDRNTASMKTILVKKMPAKGKWLAKFLQHPANRHLGMAALEEMFLHRLPLQQSRSMLLRNMSTLLCYADVPDTRAAPRAQILHLTG